MTNYDEQLAKLEQKQAQIKEQMKAIKAKKSRDERKERTRRLIQTGAILEANLNIEFNDEQRNQLANLMGHHYNNGKAFRELMTDELKKQPTTLKETNNQTTSQPTPQQPPSYKPTSQR